MLCRVAAFCRPLRPVLLLVSFPRSRSPVVGVPGLCWTWRDVPFACQRRPVVGVPGVVLVAAGVPPPTNPPTPASPPGAPPVSTALPRHRTRTNGADLSDCLASRSLSCCTSRAWASAAFVARLSSCWTCTARTRGGGAMGGGSPRRRGHSDGTGRVAHAPSGQSPTAGARVGTGAGGGSTLGANTRRGRCQAFWSRHMENTRGQRRTAKSQEAQKRSRHWSLVGSRQEWKHTHTHSGDKQSTEKTGLGVLDLVRCKAEQKQ